MAAQTWPTTADPSVVANSTSENPVREKACPITLRSRTLDFADIATPEANDVIRLIPVYKGERVDNVTARIITAGTASSTVLVGDGADADGYITAVATDGAADTITAADGALLFAAFATTPAVTGVYKPGGKLYSADDSIDLKYGATPPLAGILEIIVEVVQVWAD